MRENKQLRFQNTWDSSSMVETSSINHARNASPASRGLQGGERTQRVRPYPNKKRSKATKMLFLKRHAEIGFGFSIRGGIEHGTGIFVSNINKYSDAFSQGLQIGDQVLKGNKQSFEEVTHEEAVQFIQSQRTLRLMVLSLGIIPGSKIEHTRYQWIDCYGRPCSPLPIKTFPTTDPDNAEESGSMRPLEDNERKVNIVVGNNSRLGLLIRGGMEYGLGIFIAGIDEDSVADRSAVMVGEQIIEVNGISFLNIGHADAAHIIRTSKMMTMILKDVGKIPLARVVYDQTEWLDRRSVRSRSPQDISPRDRDSMIQSGIAGSQLHHQSVTGPTSYQWIEEKAQYCLSEDEWNTLKYYVREYVHGRLSVNEFVFSLLDLLDSNEKKSLIQEVRGIVRAQDIERFDEMMLRIEVQAIKIQNEQDSEEDNIIVLQEESMAASPYDPVYHSSSPAGRNGFDYDQLQEDSYHSTMENITQESILQQSPQKFVPRNIMDEDIIEEEEEIGEILEEPVYATVNTHKTHDAETATILKDYDNLESVKKFTTFSPPTQIKNKETVPHISERVTEEEKDFEQNKLGYAFSFLNSTNEELESPQNEVLGLTSDKKEPSDDDDDQSVVSVSSLENGEEPTPPSSISRGQHFPGFNAGSANRRQKSNVIDLDFSPSEETAPSIQDFKPKSLSNQTSANTSVPSIAIANATPEVKRKSVSDNAYVKINKGTEHASSPSFDSAPSLEHRYSNFSVNDIMRQSFLPTTRLEYDPLNSSNEDIDFLNRSVEDISRREKRLNQVSSLNIQNQYEYEKTEKLKNLSFSSTESLTKLEEPKNYGKPVMTKSPRNDFYVSSNSNTLSKKVKEEVPTIKSVNSRENNVAVEDRNFNIARFKNDTRDDNKISRTIEQHLEYRNPYDRDHSTLYKRKSPITVPKKEEKALSVDIDFRAADSPPSPYQYEPPRNTKNNAIRSRIDAFNVNEKDGNSLKKSDGTKQTSKTNSLTKPTRRTVSIQRKNDDPGFTVDSRQKQEETEMFIDEIQDRSITDLTVGDVIIGIDNTYFKKGLQKGLANLIIRNAFSNSESSEIKVHLKL